MFHGCGGAFAGRGGNNRRAKLEWALGQEKGNTAATRGGECYGATVLDGETQPASAASNASTGHPTGMNWALTPKATGSDRPGVRVRVAT